MEEAGAWTEFWRILKSRLGKHGPANLLSTLDPTAYLSLSNEHEKVYQSWVRQQPRFTDCSAVCDLTAASIHACAAYGFPFLHGYCDSAADYTRMFLTKGIGLDLTEGVDGKSQNEAVLALTGLPMYCGCGLRFSGYCCP